LTTEQEWAIEAQFYPGGEHGASEYLLDFVDGNFSWEPYWRGGRKFSSQEEAQAVATSIESLEGVARVHVIPAPY
jgi:hypothetical protein